MGKETELKQLRERMKDTIRRSRRLQVWFWDGERQYVGEATALSPGALTAFLKMSRQGDVTLLPTASMMDTLNKTLVGRLVEFKVSNPQIEASVKGKMIAARRDGENVRRVMIDVLLERSSEENEKNLARLRELFQPPA